MNDPHHSVESGMRGTVDHVDDMGQIRDIEQAIEMDEACDVSQWTMLKEKLLAKQTELTEKYKNEQKKMQHP